MNSYDWLGVSNWALAGVVAYACVEVYLIHRSIGKKLSTVERKLDLVLAADLEADHAWPSPEERGAETAPRDEDWRPGAEPSGSA